VHQVTVDVDVTEAAGLGEALRTRATVTLPDPEHLVSPPVACFGFPGGGYGRSYFHLDVPDASAPGTRGGQAAWHAERGWVFVACDHLCVGESSMPSDPSAVSFEVMAAVNAATVDHVTALLTGGELAPGFPPLDGLTRIGIGQSMGGCLLIVQQGQLATFDAIAVLGYSAVHTVLAMPPGTPPIPMPYAPRGTKVSLDDAQARAQEVTGGDQGAAEAPTAADLPFTTWGFHMDDEPPPCSISMLSPGVVAPEAAMITTPVLVAVGERDVVPDPKADPKAYQRSSDVTVVVWPNMAHMHNFAATREGFWNRLHVWGDGVARRHG
jgi:alpha-beta hydrolase superfamily lysophospholipase